MPPGIKIPNLGVVANSTCHCRGAQAPLLLAALCNPPAHDMECVCWENTIVSLPPALGMWCGRLLGLATAGAEDHAAAGAHLHERRQGSLPRQLKCTGTKKTMSLPEWSDHQVVETC